MIGLQQHSPQQALIHAAAHTGTLSLLSHMLPDLRPEEIPNAYSAVLAEMRAAIETFLILADRQSSPRLSCRPRPAGRRGPKITGPAAPRGGTHV